MEFRLTDEQLELQAAIRSFCETQYTLATLGELDRDPLRGDGWQRLAALDVFRVASSTEQGGLGLGVVDASVVFEVLGAYLVPGPLVWSALAARYVPELGDGSRVIGGLDATAVSDESVLVEYARDLDALLVMRVDGLHLVAPEDIASLEAVEPTDPLTPVALALGIPRGRIVLDAATTAQLRVVGTVLTAALLVGIADRATRSGVDYAQQRTQFGRPIGSFQAIKHLLADSYVRASLARSATYAAAAMLDDPDVGDADRAASAAKLLSTDAAIRNSRTCIQTHGGMGFTWEMIPHYLLKRAWVLDHSFGERKHHEEIMANALEREMSH